MRTPALMWIAILGGCESGGSGDSVGNSSPVFVGVSPESGTVIPAGEGVLLSAQVADDHDAPDQIAVRFTSDVDGRLGEVAADESGFASQFVADLSPGPHAITVRATDRDNVSNETRVDLRLNRPPIPSRALILPETPRSDDTIELVLTSLAADPDEDSVITGIEWYRNDVLVDAYNGAEQIPSTATFRGETWRARAWAEDPWGAVAATELTVEVMNTPPVASGVHLDPAGPRAGEPVLCMADEATDLDNDPVTLRYRWIVNGVDSGVTDATLPAERVVEDAVLSCQILPTDGRSTGTVVMSEETTVGNGVPSVSGLVVEPMEPVAGDTLTCTATGFSDPDGDWDRTKYVWRVNGAQVAEGPVLEGGFVGGDELACRATPFDGKTFGDPVEELLLVGNSGPVVGAVSMGPIDPHAGQTLSCNAEDVVDPDGLAHVTLAYTWRVNNEPIAPTNATLVPGWFVHGDEVACEVIASDGEASSAPVVAEPLTVANRLPQALGLRMEPAAPTAVDTVSCVYTWLDEDGDPDRSAVSWFVNDAWVGNGPTAPAGFVRGDVLRCRVTPNDGLDDGVRVSVAATVANAAPTLLGVTLDPEDAVAGMDLMCLSDGEVDPDGDSVALLTSWYINGELVSEDEVLEDGFVHDDLVTCEVTPNDGIVDGFPVQTTTLIGNAVPRIVAMALEPTDPAAGEEVICGYAFEDADGDSDQSVVRWFVDDVIVGAAPRLTYPTEDGDRLTCEVTPFDGREQGVPATLTVDVGP